MKNTILLLAGILIFCTSCKYLNKTCSYSDLEIERNTIGLKKISLSESGINSYNSWLNQYARWQLGCGKDEEYNAQGQWREANGKQAEIMYGNSDVRIYQNVKFADKVTDIVNIFSAVFLDRFGSEHRSITVSAIDQTCKWFYGVACPLRRTAFICLECRLCFLPQFRRNYPLVLGIINFTLIAEFPYINRINKHIAQNRKFYRIATVVQL